MNKFVSFVCTSIVPISLRASSTDITFVTYCKSFRSKRKYARPTAWLARLARVYTTELYYISGDCALIPRQSTNCNKKHGGFWPNLRHFDVTVSLFSCRTPLTRYLSGKNLSMSRGQWMAP